MFKKAVKRLFSEKGQTTPEWLNVVLVAVIIVSIVGLAVKNVMVGNGDPANPGGVVGTVKEQIENTVSGLAGSGSAGSSNP